MEERMMVKEEIACDELRFESISLVRAKEAIEGLIAQHGEGAIIYFESVSLEVVRPETEHEMRHRIHQEEVRALEAEAKASALAKLTLEEKRALRLG